MIGYKGLIIVAFNYYYARIPQSAQTGLGGLGMGGIANIAEMIYGSTINVCEHPKGSFNGFRLSMAIRHDSDHNFIFSISV